MSSVDKAREKLSIMLGEYAYNKPWDRLTNQEKRGVNIVAMKAFSKMEELGYRKPPEGEQDLLLTPEAIIAIIKKHDGDLAQMWNTREVDGKLTVDSCMNYVLQAQLAKAKQYYNSQGIYCGTAIIEEAKKQEREKLINKGAFCISICKYHIVDENGHRCGAKQCPLDLIDWQALKESPHLGSCPGG